MDSESNKTYHREADDIIHEVLALTVAAIIIATVVLVLVRHAVASWLGAS